MILLDLSYNRFYRALWKHQNTSTKLKLILSIGRCRKLIKASIYKKNQLSAINVLCNFKLLENHTSPYMQIIYEKVKVDVITLHNIGPPIPVENVDVDFAKLRESQRTTYRHSPSLKHY